MENNKTLSVLLIILSLSAIAAAGYLGYVYLNPVETEDVVIVPVEEKPVEELTEEEVVEEADEAVDSTIDEIVEDLESLETDEDYEDFDSELEFGVAL